MSLILEALRKSEAERQRDGTPNVAMELPPVPVRGDGATPAWVWPTLAVVVVGAILAGWLGMRADKRDRTAHNEPPAAEAEAATPAHSPGPIMAPAAAARPMVAPAPPPEPTLATAPAPPATTVAAASAPDDGVRVTEHPVPPPPLPAVPIAQPRPGPAPAITAVDDSEDAPPIAATGLPAVKLSMHMWDTDPAKRFVIIDGQRMGEGDHSGVLAVIAIRRDGVIIERNGLRAKVPLP